MVHNASRVECCTSLNMIPDTRQTFLNDEPKDNMQPQHAATLSIREWNTSPQILSLFVLFWVSVKSFVALLRRDG